MKQDQVAGESGMEGAMRDLWKDAMPMIVVFLMWLFLQAWMMGPLLFRLLFGH